MLLHRRAEKSWEMAERFLSPGIYLTYLIAYLTYLIYLIAKNLARFPMVQQRPMLMKSEICKIY